MALYFLLCLIASIRVAAGSQCNEFCKKTYPLHTFPKENLYYSCIRGCRLGKIDQLSGNLRTKDQAINFCKLDCRHAYDMPEDLSACDAGCTEQDILPTPAGLLQVEMEKASFHRPVVHQIIVQPVRVFRRYCSGIFSNVFTFVAMKTAFSTEGNNQESITIHFQGGPLVEIDATRHEGQLPEIASKTVDEEPKKSESYYNRLYYHGSRWIDCVAARARLPSWLLSFALLLCFFTATWLCCSTLVGADSHEEKRYTFEKTITAEPLDSQKSPLFTVERYEAPPLPVKTKLANIA